VDIIDNAGTLNNHEVHTQDQREIQDPIQDLGGPMTRSRTKLTQETLQKMVVNLMEVHLHDDAQHVDVLLTCIMCLEGEQKALFLDFE